MERRRGATYSKEDPRVRYREILTLWDDYIVLGAEWLPPQPTPPSAPVFVVRNLQYTILTPLQPANPKRPVWNNQKKLPINLPLPSSLSFRVYPKAYASRETVHPTPSTLAATGYSTPAISIAITAEGLVMSSVRNYCNNFGSHKCSYWFSIQLLVHEHQKLARNLAESGPPHCRFGRTHGRVARS